jgi:hypothetical protein
MYGVKKKYWGLEIFFLILLELYKNNILAKKDIENKKNTTFATSF